MQESEFSSLFANTVFSVYLFSVRNPEAVELGDKPNLQQLGPFVFRENLERVNEVFHKNGTVSYETKKIWFYIPEESLPLSTMVTTVNVPIVAAAEFARGKWFQVLTFIKKTTLV